MIFEIDLVTDKLWSCIWLEAKKRPEVWSELQSYFIQWIKNEDDEPNTLCLVRVPCIAKCAKNLINDYLMENSVVSVAKDGLVLKDSYNLFGVGANVFMPTAKCICGSEKLGHPGHSHWCEKFKAVP